MREQIDLMCSYSNTVDNTAHGLNNRGVVDAVEPFLIRDPVDPCLKFSSYPLSRQFGLRARKNTEIAAGTVIGEYSGDLYRDGESPNDFEVQPVYGFSLSYLDKHASGIYTLDARRYGNETSLINDANENFVDEESHSAGTRVANVDFIEVLVDGKPRIFLVSKRNINSEEEILVSYGDAYWERYRTYHHKLKIPPRRSIKRRIRENGPEGDFVSSPLEIGEIESLKWNEASGLPAGEVVTPNAFRLGVGKKIRQTMLEYCNKTGITTRARRITIGGGSLNPGMDELATIGGSSWCVQRHSSHGQSNLHWISPADEDAHVDFLSALSFAGFDKILGDIGSHFCHFETLAVYQVSFICVSKCKEGRLHYDITGSGGRAFNIIVPLILANNTGPELEVRPSNDEDPPTVGEYRYERDSAIMLGDDAFHATGEVDYDGEFRLAMSLYVADIRSDNINALKESFTNYYETDLLSRVGSHWSKRNERVCLPRPTQEHILKKSTNNGGGRNAIRQRAGRKRRGRTAANTEESQPAAKIRSRANRSNARNDGALEDGITKLADALVNTRTPKKYVHENSKIGGDLSVNTSIVLFSFRGWERGIVQKRQTMNQQQKREAEGMSLPTHVRYQDGFYGLHDLNDAPYISEETFDNLVSGSTTEKEEGLCPGAWCIVHLEEVV